VGTGHPDVVLTEIARDELEEAWLIVDHDYVHRASVCRQVVAAGGDEWAPGCLPGRMEA
jgi:hypothetical protein